MIIEMVLHVASEVLPEVFPEMIPKVSPRTSFEVTSKLVPEVAPEIVFGVTSFQSDLRNSLNRFRGDTTVIILMCERHESHYIDFWGIIHQFSHF